MVVSRPAARNFAGRGARIHLACRSRAKGEAAVAAITAETGNHQIGYLPLDLAETMLRSNDAKALVR